jgi:hypothetical protein
MKEFARAVQEATEEEQPLEFKVEGHDEVLRSFKPSDGQLAMLMASTGRHTSEHTQVAGIIDFFVSLLDEPSQLLTTDWLLDRTDPFGIEMVNDIMAWMVEEWTARPTPLRSVSTP